MTHSLMGSRKRGRGNCEEECCVPLSKRINNLHINRPTGVCCNNAEHAQQSPSNENDNPEHWASLGTAGMYPGMNGHNNPTYASNDVIDARLVQSQQYLGNAIESNPNPALTQQWMANQGLPQYSPELDASANPFYYDNNKLLYDLYVERIQRGGMM